MKKNTKYPLLYHITEIFSVNSQCISINTNSTLLGSSSSPTMTHRETTTEMICKSTIIADATSGREQL